MFGTDAALTFSNIVKNEGLNLIFDLLNKVFVLKALNYTVQVQVSITDMTMTNDNTFLSN